MSKYVDANVTPGSPVFGDQGDSRSRLQVYNLASGVALGETTFPALLSTLPPPDKDKSAEAMWLNFTCDNGAGIGVPFYLITTEIGDPSSNPGALAVPDPLATALPLVTPEQQCIYVPADGEYHRKFGLDQRFRAIQLSGAVAFLRVEGTSEGG